MICTQCGTKNAGGRLFCIKCGIEISNMTGTVGQVGAPGASAPPKRGKMVYFRYAVYGIILIAFAACALALLPAPDAEVVVSEKAARNFEIQKRHLENKGKGRAEYTVAFTAEQINSYLREWYIGFGLKDVRIHVKEDVILEDMYVKLEGNRMEFHMRYFFEYKFIKKVVHISIGGTVSDSNRRAELSPDYLRVGKLVLPVQLVPRIMSLVKNGDPLSLDLAKYVTNVEVKDDKLMIQTGKQ